MAALCPTLEGTASTWKLPLMESRVGMSAGGWKGDSAGLRPQASSEKQGWRKLKWGVKVASGT